jgi:hypothetical protein
MGCVYSTIEECLFKPIEINEFFKIQGTKETEPMIKFYDITNNYDDI